MYTIYGCLSLTKRQYLIWLSKELLWSTFSGDLSFDWNLDSKIGWLNKFILPLHSYKRVYVLESFEWHGCDKDFSWSVLFIQVFLDHSISIIFLYFLGSFPYQNIGVLPLFLPFLPLLFFILGSLNNRILILRSIIIRKSSIPLFYPFLQSISSLIHF